MTSSGESLERAIERVGSPVELLRNSSYPPFEFPVPPEFSNWRSEQAAWRETCALLDQSHHMADLFLEGPDAFRLLAGFGVNSFEGFVPGKVKQYVAVNRDGYFIGDSILFYLGEGLFDLVGISTVLDWVQFQGETGPYDVTIERDDNSARRVGPPRLYRFELQGPTAGPLVEALNGAPVAEVPFFGLTELMIAGHDVRALRHGMAGQPGFEIFGPWEHAAEVLAAILVIGVDFGLVRAGAKAYSTANLESGWIPRPPTAVFGDHEKAFREWLPAAAMGSLGGSMDSLDITDYYLTPYDLGYGRLVKFDHDFLGREALEAIAKSPARKKVTLVWNIDDVMAAIRSHLESGTPAKYIEIPKSRYAACQVDRVLRDGETVGISTDVGYIANERAFVSLATVDLPVSELGTAVTVLWGEEPNSRKSAIEPHRQVEIRATVGPVPYARPARESYRTS